MSKTITVRVDESTYNLIKSAADGEKRTISNFLEYAATQYISQQAFVDDDEMDEILNDSELMESLQKGNEEVEQGKYKFVD